MQPTSSSSPINKGSGDADGDDLTNTQEIYDYNSNPTKSNTDNDGLNDAVEVQYSWSPVSDQSPTNGSLGDFDGDNLSNIGEVILGLNLTLADTDTDTDTDSDGRSDLLEVQQGWGGTSVASPFYNTTGDEDGDNLLNLQELAAGTNLLIADTDGDGLNDKPTLRALGEDITLLVKP